MTHTVTSETSANVTHTVNSQTSATVTRTVTSETRVPFPSPEAKQKRDTGVNKEQSFSQVSRKSGRKCNTSQKTTVYRQLEFKSLFVVF